MNINNPFKICLRGLQHAMLLILPCLPLAMAQAQQSMPVVESERLSDTVLLIKGPQSNVLAVASNEGLILVDGGHADWYDSLRDTLNTEFPGMPIRALINTHWHPEHTGANVPLGSEGVEIIAHENTMLWLSTEVRQRWSGKVYKPMPKAGLPTTTVWNDGSMQLGDQVVHYGFMWNAHTDGDIWVYFENENVLVTGGPVSNGSWPGIDWETGGYIGALLDGFVSLLTVPNAETRIIPAKGDVMGLDDLKAQNQMYITIFDRLHGAVIQSFDLNDVLAEKLAEEFSAMMGDPTQFMTQAFESFQGRYRDAQNFRLLNIP